MISIESNISRLRKIVNKITFLKLLVFFALPAIFLAACSTDVPSPTQTISSQTPTLEPTTTTTSTASPTSTPSPTPTSSPTPTYTPAPIAYGPTDFPLNVNPLTGLVVEDKSILERRPIAVKINIVPRGSNRPPWGISFADIVYDYYHNDGYSRFHAIFYGNDAELVGPIRSGRMLDNDLVHMYRSIFAYGSADRLVNNRLLNADYSNRVILEGSRSDCPPTPEKPLCRYEPRGYDFLLGGTAAMSDHLSALRIENGRQNLDGMSFYPVPPEGGKDGIQLTVRYSGDNYVRWDYDATSGRYLRFQDAVYDTGSGEEFDPLVDRLTEKQVSADNVVVIFARHEYYQQPPNEIVEIQLSGKGTAYAFRDGKMYEVVWNRPTIESVLYLTFPDGTNYSFKPGTTWIQVVGEFSLVKEIEDGIWRYDFRIP